MATYFFSSQMKRGTWRERSTFQRAHTHTHTENELELEYLPYFCCTVHGALPGYQQQQQQCFIFLLNWDHQLLAKGHGHLTSKSVTLLSTNTRLRVRLGTL